MVCSPTRKVNHLIQFKRISEDLKSSTLEAQDGGFTPSFCWI